MDGSHERLGVDGRLGGAGPRGSAAQERSSRASRCAIVTWPALSTLSSRTAATRRLVRMPFPCGQPRKRTPGGRHLPQRLHAELRSGGQRPAHRTLAVAVESLHAGGMSDRTAATDPHRDALNRLCRKVEFDHGFHGVHGLHHRNALLGIRIRVIPAIRGERRGALRPRATQAQGSIDVSFRPWTRSSDSDGIS